MALTTYREVLAQPKAPSVLLLGFLARFPFSSTGLVLTLHCVLTLNQTYFWAGLIVTSATLGAAISAPWRGRMLDTKGLRRTLIPPVIVNLIFWSAAPFLPYAALVPSVFVAGLFSIPVFSIVRTSLAVIMPARLRKASYALDSVFTEFVFMTGPAMATVLVFTLNSTVALLAVGAAVVLAGIGLMAVNPPLRSDQLMIPAKLSAPLEAAEGGTLREGAQIAERIAFESTRTGQIPVIAPDQLDSEPGETTLEDQARHLARRQLLSLGGMAILLATAMGNVILVATDLGIVALLQGFGQENLVGLVITVWCAGSAVGGLAYGAMKHDLSPLWVLLFLGISTVPIAFAPNLAIVLVLCAISGLGVAPIIASTGEAIAQRVPEMARGEAMGWHGSAMTIGASAGGPVIGTVIDHAGAPWGFVTGGLAGLTVATFGLIATKIHRARLRERMAAELKIEH